MGDMLKKGNYTGFYKYDKDVLQKAMGVEQTPFEMEIIETDGKDFFGTVREEPLGRPRTATITGTTQGDQIKFTKRIPNASTITTSGVRKEYNVKHPRVYYKGSFRDGMYVGTWKVRFFMRITSRGIMVSPTTRGTWGMKGA
jgi:hypothetical protein